MKAFWEPFVKAFAEPFRVPFLEGMANYLSPLTLHPRTLGQASAELRVDLQSPAVLTSVDNFQTARAAA